MTSCPQIESACAHIDDHTSDDSSMPVQAEGVVVIVVIEVAVQVVVVVVVLVEVVVELAQVVPVDDDLQYRLRQR